MRAVREPCSLHRSHCLLLRILEEAITLLINREPPNKVAVQGASPRGKGFLDLAALNLVLWLPL